MKLYCISQDENDNYDTYDSAVVAAPDEETARNTNPYGDGLMAAEQWAYIFNGWCSSPEAVTVRYIGEAAEGVPQGVICASYNAG